MQPEEQKSWFHCGRCGSVFLAVPGESVGRTCPSCGRHPVAFGEASAALKTVTVGTSASAAVTESASRRKKRAKRSQASRVVIKVVLAWFVLLGGIIWFSARMWDQDKEIGAQSRSNDEYSGGEGNADAAFARNALDACGQTLFNFLQSRATEQRGQYVRKPLQTIGRMSRYYGSNPPAVIDPDDLQLDRVDVLHLGADRALSGVWKVADGRLIETVFFREDDEWRLDWDHFVRYSDHPWTFFLNGDGPDSGEFRVLARERLSVDRRKTPEIGIVCYAPRFGFPADAGTPSPEFLLTRDSEAGRMLVAAFDDLAANRKPFGDTAVWDDPDEMIRLRIRVRREQAPEGYRFFLEKVVACHWISTDDPGVTPAPAPASPPDAAK